MVRQLGIKGTVEKTERRKLSEKVSDRKIETGIIDECPWKTYEQEPFEDTEIGW